MPLNIIYLSGLTIIGVPKNIPITEDHHVKPLNIYHALKYFGENLINLDKSNEIDSLILRSTIDWS